MNRPLDVLFVSADSSAQAYQEYFSHLTSDGVLQINNFAYPRVIAGDSARVAHGWVRSYFVLQFAAVSHCSHLFVQMDEQPSPSFVLPSSQISPGSSESLPHTASTAPLMRWVAPAVDWPERPAGSAPATLKYRSATNFNPCAVSIAASTCSSISFDQPYGFFGHCRCVSLIGT